MSSTYNMSNIFMLNTKTCFVANFLSKHIQICFLAFVHTILQIYKKHALWQMYCSKCIKTCV